MAKRKMTNNKKNNYWNGLGVAALLIVFVVGLLTAFSLSPSSVNAAADSGGSTGGTVASSCAADGSSKVTGSGSGKTMDKAITKCIERTEAFCKSQQEAFCDTCEDEKDCVCDAPAGKATCSITDDSCVKYDEDGNIIGNISGQTCTAEGEVTDCKRVCADKPPKKKKGGDPFPE